MSYKKMKSISRFGLVGKCDCGHQQKFKGLDIDLENSNSTTAIFKDLYVCPKCNEIYEGIYDEKAKKYKPISKIITAIFIIGLLFIGYKIFFPTPTYTNINSATNNQLQDFFNWDHKQQQEKYDNSPAFNNNK